MRKKRTVLVLTFLSLVLALVAGCTQQTGQVELSTAEYDFGRIPNTEPVSEVFEVRNIGQGKLEITGVSTSCGCTTAEVDKRQLGPGEWAELTVTYDPQAHGGATGQFMRVIYVRTSDPDLPETELIVHVTVTES
jgi:hypothetical protein